MKKLSILMMIMLLLASCSQDAFDNNNTGMGKEVTAHFSFTTKSMIQKLLGDARAVTRSTAASTVNDTQLTDMWVVQFDNSGNFIKKSYTASVNSTSFDVPLQTNVAGATSTIYFLANIGSTLVSPNGGEAAFKTQVMSIATESNLLPTGSPLKSVPMIGSVTGITVPAAGYINNTSVQLTRLLAQIDITTTVDPSFASNFILEKIRVCNVPNGAQFCTPAAATTTPKTSAGVTGYINLPYETTTSGSTVTFYLPENQQGEGTNTAATDERLKSGVANATYVELVGHTIGTTTCGDEVHYYVYLGGDIMNNYNIIRNTHYTLSPTLKGMNVADKRISIGERPNCYILQTVDPTTNLLGKVNIPIKHANDSGLGTQVGDVRTITASQITTSWQTANSTNNMLTFDTSNLDKGYFTVKYNYATFGATPGDAVVALKDASGNILWTWHIWMVTPANDPTLPANQITANGNTWMKFNLGACNMGYAPCWSGLTAGLIYQWGRKDPFPSSDNTGSCVAGGAIYNYTSPAFSNPAITLIPPPPGEVVVKLCDVSANYGNGLLYSVRYPLLFMYNWAGSTATAAASASQGTDSWGGDYGQPKNTAYDPCPEGYRVPSFHKISTTDTSPWVGLTYSSTSGNSPAFWGTDTSAYAYGSYELCGFRDGVSNGMFANVSSNGYYWSASVAVTNAYNLLLLPGSTTPASNNSRAHGCSVRCVKSW